MIEKIVNNLVKNLLKIEIIKSEEKVLYEYLHPFLIRFG